MITLPREMEKGFDFGLAVAEASRCLLCHDPPCSRGCPAGTDPGTFIRKFRFRNITGAIRTIKNNNILGGACGILCPTARLCEKECSAIGIGRPIQIGKLQRFLIEYSYDIGFKVFSKVEQKLQKVAIIGSGPAGLSCAAELAKEGYIVTVFEKMPEPGGVMRYGVPAHRFDSDFLKREIQDILDLGVEIKCNNPFEGSGEAEELLKKGFHAVFLAPGLWQSVPLNDRTKNMKGVLSSIHFLMMARENKLKEISEFIGGKEVAVIGGGSVSIDCAESALKFGASNVYLIYRRSYTEMPAEEDERISALKNGVHFILLTKPIDYIGNSQGVLKQIKLKRTRLGEIDSSGRRKPVDIPGSEITMDIDTVIEAIGQQAEDNSIKWYPSVKVNSKKLILINDKTGETSVKGIFAGGDIVRGPSLIVEAVRDGKTAARAIIEHLGNVKSFMKKYDQERD